jgi:hypothetical protein
MKNRGKGTKKAQNAKLIAPKPKIHWVVNRLNMQADPRQKARPRTDCLRNDYLAADDRPRSVGCQKMLDRKPDCRYKDSLRPRWSPERGS